MKSNGQTIFIISNEHWGPVWYSKHHYANELSASNIVYFINPPSKWKFTNLFSFGITTGLRGNTR